MSHFPQNANFQFATALRALSDRVSSLLRRDGHPSRSKPQGQELPAMGTPGQVGDERAAIAANLRPGPVRQLMDKDFRYVDMSFCSAGPDGLTIPPRRQVTQIGCGCDWHCMQGHHTCDDGALD